MVFCVARCFLQASVCFCGGFDSYTAHQVSFSCKHLRDLIVDNKGANLYRCTQRYTTSINDVVRLVTTGICFKTGRLFHQLRFIIVETNPLRLSPQMLRPHITHWRRIGTCNGSHTAQAGVLGGRHRQDQSRTKGTRGEDQGNAEEEVN